MSHGSKKAHTATVPVMPSVCPYKEKLVDEILARLLMEEADAKVATDSK